MYYFTVRFDLPRGQEMQFEEYLARAKAFWMSQPGVREFHVYGDVLVDWPERRIEIAITDRESLQRILDSEERRALRSEMLSFTKQPFWQLLELQDYGYLEERIAIGTKSESAPQWSGCSGMSSTNTLLSS
jgi:hypothetical protein